MPSSTSSPSLLPASTLLGDATMTDDDYSYDDDGFTHYEASTVDPGPYLLISTVLFCALLYCCLPFVVVLCNRIEAWKQRRTNKKNDTLCSEDEEHPIERGQAVRPACRICSGPL